MKTEFMSADEKDSVFGKIFFGSFTARDSAILKIQNYITALEDRIKHLEFMEESKDSIIKFHEGMREGYY